MAVDIEGLGLRERKRRRTRDAIARAALELFDRQGFHDTTIAQVAEAADVSPRTVSGYFPHKEDLAFPDSEEAFASLDLRLRDRPDGETTAEALRSWIEGWLHDHAGRDEELRMRRRVVEADEALRAYEHRFMHRAGDAIAEAVARDLGCDPSELEPRMAAAATLAVFELLDAALEPARRSDRDALALVDRALLFIGAGIRALRGDVPA
jgi:AcrR family transcriptional regulator